MESIAHKLGTLKPVKALAFQTIYLCCSWTKKDKSHMQNSCLLGWRAYPVRPTAWGDSLRTVLPGLSQWASQRQRRTFCTHSLQLLAGRVLRESRILQLYWGPLSQSVFPVEDTPVHYGINIAFSHHPRLPGANPHLGWANRWYSWALLNVWWGANPPPNHKPLVQTNDLRLPAMSNW